MASFKDCEGREWSVRITHGDALRIRGEVKVDLYKLLDGKMEKLAALLADPEKLVAVVWCLVEKQADRGGIDEVGFGMALDGDATEGMAEALMDALADFTPNRRAREALRKALAKGKEVADLKAQGAILKIEAIDAAKVATMDLADLEKTLGGLTSGS